MALRMSTLPAALMIALAAGSVEGRLTFGEASSKLSVGKSHTSSTRSSSSVTRVSASVKCSSESYADAYSGRTDDYTAAVTRLVRDACNSSWKGNLQVLRDEAFGWAGAWASATADVAASCVSRVSGGGRAQGCAYSEAAAYAFEVAFAEAHASASAEAFDNYCDCNNAEVWAFGDASLFLELIASVFSKASAAACASGNEASSASAYASCYASAAADTYAKAAAKATIEAECGYYQKARVISDVMAEVGSDLYIDEACTFTEDRDGLTEASAGGDATAYVSS